MSFRHQCRERGCYLATQAPDWAILEGAFPRGIYPTDLDGFVELNGYFLTLEWKGADAELTKGQELAFQRRTQSSKVDTVIVIYGDAASMEIVAIRIIYGGKIGDRIAATNESFVAKCASWAKYAENQSTRY